MSSEEDYPRQPEIKKELTSLGSMSDASLLCTEFGVILCHRISALFYINIRTSFEVRNEYLSLHNYNFGLCSSYLKF
jgi:hypothetical protein